MVGIITPALAAIGIRLCKGQHGLAARFALPLLLASGACADHTGPIIELPLKSNYQAEELELTARLYVSQQRPGSPSGKAPVMASATESTAQRSAVSQSVLFRDDAFTLDTPAFGRALLSQRVSYRVGWVASNALYHPQQDPFYKHPAISSSGTLPLPGVGFGAYGLVKPNPRLAITAGIHEDVMHRWNSENVDRNAYFSALGINYQPAWPTLGAEQYTLTLWRRNASGQDAGGSGLALNVARAYHERVDWSPFLKVSYRQAGNTPGAETIASTGVNVSRLPWNPDESAGFAYAHQKSSSSDSATHTVEMYYRLMPTPYLEVTPNLQLVYQSEGPVRLEHTVASQLHFRLLF